MAPRRRAVHNDTAQNGSAAAGRFNAAGAGGGARRSPSEDDEEESTPAFDIVAACMAYTSKLEEENKIKARKWKNEAGKIADDYKKKTEALILEEQREVKAAYDVYREENDKDLLEKERILKKIAENLEGIEKLTTTVIQRNKNHEDVRYNRTLKALQIAEQNRAAASEEAANALEAKRKEVHERTRVGDDVHEPAVHSKL